MTMNVFSATDIKHFNEIDLESQKVVTVLINRCNELNKKKEYKKMIGVFIKFSEEYTLVPELWNKLTE